MISMLGTLETVSLLLSLFFKAHQHKAAGRKTRLDTKLWLLGDHGVVDRNHISSLESHGKALEKECCLPDAQIQYV